MKLISLELENFRQHANSKIDFPDGITVISGTNGTGKSTILEAISWAIYGTEAIRGKKDSIVWNKAEKNKVTVKLVFELDDDKFTIIRELKKAEIYLNDNESPIATSQDEVSKYISEKLGMEKNEFFNTYFTGQKELQFLSGQKATERKKFISKVLGYEKIRYAQEKVRSDKNSLGNKIIGMENGLENRDDIIENKKTAIAKLNLTEKDLKEKNKKFSKFSIDLADIEPKYAKNKDQQEDYLSLNKDLKFLKEKQEYLSKNINAQEEQIKGFENKEKDLNKLKNIDKEYKELETNIKQQEKLQEKEALRQSLYSKIESLEKEIKEKQELLETITESGKEKRKIVNKIPVLKEELEKTKFNLKNEEESWNNLLQENKMLISQRNTEIDKLKTQLETIKKSGKDGNCPTCRRALKNEYDTVVKDFNDNILEVEKAIKQLELEKGTLLIKPEKISKMIMDIKEKEQKYIDLAKFEGQYQEERNRYKITNNEITSKKQELEKNIGLNKEIPDGFDIEKLKSLREKMSFVRGEFEKKLAIEAELKNSETIKKSYTSSKKDLNNLIDEIKEKEAELKKNNFSQDDFEKTEALYSIIKTDFYNYKEEVIKTEAEVTNAQNNLEHIKNLENSYKEKLKSIEIVKNEHNHLIELERFYGEFWEKLNSEARPDISELASIYLKELTDGRYTSLELNEKYEICLYDDGEIKPVISGGEEDVANLSVRLAVSQIIAERSGKSLSLLVLDEIFGSLDEDRRNNVIELLNSLLNKFEQVILITHIDDIKEGLTNFITIEYDEEKGCSVIKANQVQEGLEILV